MEIFKTIAVIIGGILSFISLIGICSKGGRTFIKNLFKKNTSEIHATNEQQNKDIEDIKGLLTQIAVDLDLVKDSSKQQLRNIIKNVYYRYRLEKKIPIYERKTADVMYELYHKGFHSNSYITLLYKEICKWTIDTTTERELDED